MGVRGLLGFVARKVPRVRHNLLEEGGGIVIIDGPNFKFQLVQKLLPPAMTNWELVESAPALSVHYILSKMIEALNNAGVAVVACYDNDAANVQEFQKKKQTLVTRERENMRSCDELKSLHSQIDPHNPSTSVLTDLRELTGRGIQPTMFGKLVQVEYLRGHNGMTNFIFYPRSYDADTIIMAALVNCARYLGDKPVLGVFSNDSDFLTCPNIRLITPLSFDVNGMFMEAIRAGRTPTQLSCEVVYGETIRSTFGFHSPTQLGELAALAGNDYTKHYLYDDRPSDFFQLAQIIKERKAHQYVTDLGPFMQGLSKTLEMAGIYAPADDIEEDLRRLVAMAAARPPPRIDYLRLSLKDFLYERCLTGRCNNSMLLKHTTQLDSHPVGYLTLSTSLHIHASARLLEIDKLGYSASRIDEPTTLDILPIPHLKLQSVYGHGDRVLSLLSKLARVATYDDVNRWEHFADVPNSYMNYGDAIIGSFISLVRYMDNPEIDAHVIPAACILTGRISQSMEPTAGVAKWVVLEGRDFGREADVLRLRDYLLFEQQEAVSFHNSVSDVYACQLLQCCVYTVTDFVGLLTEDPLEPYRIIDGRVLALLKYAPPDMFEGGMGRLKRETFERADRMLQRVYEF